MSLAISSARLGRPAGETEPGVQGTRETGLTSEPRAVVSATGHACQPDRRRAATAELRGLQWFGGGSRSRLAGKSEEVSLK